MITLLLVSTALAYQHPNSTLGASIGYPSLVGGRGEAWLANELSVEIGAGTFGAADPFGFNVTWRWRPDILCISCGKRTLITFGVGAGSTIIPPVGFEGPWAFAVGPDIAATAVYWLSPSLGLSLSAHGGIGPGWVGDAFDEIAVTPWGFGSLGLAF